MRLVFAGTPDFARVALDALVAAGHEVPLVLTQPDRPAGRGMKLQPSAVKQAALAHGCPVAQPRSLRLDGKFADDAAQARNQLLAAQPDAMVVAAYGLILPPWVLELPRRGCLNIHASLLPRWRGAAPIHRAIEAGDAETGITIMQMDAGLDTGPMLLTERVAIPHRATTGQLHDLLAGVGGRLIVDALHRLSGTGLRAQAQPAEGITYAHKIDKAEADIDWHAHAVQIERRIRAFDPFPGATTHVDGELLKCWEACAEPSGGTPAPAGTVLEAGADGLLVACGEGVLRLNALQRAGGKRQPAAALLRAHPIPVGTRLG